MHNQQYCNNCDKSGHSFHNCRKPFISSGIIAFRQRNDKTNEYLIICRRHTFGYIDFMRGRFAINNKTQLIDIIYEMTEDEKKSIMENNFDKSWLDLWGSTSNSYYKNERIFAREKYNMLMRGVTIKADYYNTKSLILESKTNWKTPEWGFPKGRKNLNETQRECALREWSEETGIPSNKISLLDNVIPYNEYVIGSNYQSYRDNYYIGKFQGEDIDLDHYQKKEISGAKWATLDEIKDHIRPYHIERLKIIEKVNTILEKWIVT
jgi:ADP-ribose pyrophosphatase YjhB (NUDIX family)